MSADLKPYPEYKESGLPWLGQVPGHWEVLPLGRLLAERKEMNEPIKTNNSGAGKRYLIQHSAGSGKSNSIAWLAHQLIGLSA